jgi:hypothetical protein
MESTGLFGPEHHRQSLSGLFSAGRTKPANVGSGYTYYFHSFCLTDQLSAASFSGINLYSPGLGCQKAQMCPKVFPEGRVDILGLGQHDLGIALGSRPAIPRIPTIWLSLGR